MTKLLLQSSNSSKHMAEQLFLMPIMSSRFRRQWFMKISSLRNLQEQLLELVHILRQLIKILETSRYGLNKGKKLYKINNNKSENIL